MIARRNSMTPEEVLEKSLVVQRRIMKMPEYMESDSVGLYADFNNEVSTSLIIDEALREGKKVLLPCIKGRGLLFFSIRGRDELEVGPFGILAPRYSEEKLDRIEEAGFLLVPGVAYDPKGGRIGYGGGFYDRTLGRLARRPFVVAPAYDIQVLDEMPMMEHDVRVDVVVTESRTILCKNI